MKMKKLNIYIIGLLTLMLCGIQSCALESEVFDEITPSIYPQTERDVRDLVTGNAYSPFQNYDYGGLYNVANGHGYRIWFLLMGRMDLGTSGICSLDPQ